MEPAPNSVLACLKFSAIAACAFSDEEVGSLVASSDDRFQSGLEDEDGHQIQHPWQGGGVQYNLVTALSSIFELGGRSPSGENFVGSLLAQKLSEASKSRHLKAPEENSHWPDKVDDAKESRRFIVVIDTALAPIITKEDEQILRTVATRINMDLDSICSADGQKHIREYDDSNGGDVGFASHSSIKKFNMFEPDLQRQKWSLHMEKNISECNSTH